MSLCYCRENKLTAIGSTREKNCSELPACDNRWTVILSESYVMEQKLKKKKHIYKVYSKNKNTYRLIEKNQVGNYIM